MINPGASRPFSLGSVMLLALGISTYATPAAAVVEPNGLAVPQPLGSGDAPFEKTPGSLTLASLFASRGEQIDWQADASTSPAVFSPQCGFTGTLVLRGGGCKVDFGWYNVGANNTPPSDGEIYTLVPKTDPIFNNTFQPQAGETGQTFSASAILTDPNYKGGLIAFALKGNPAEACSQTHYSQPALNITCTNCTPPAPWITSLIYKSTATPSAYYVAFEDLPMSPTDFKGFPGQQYTNDGDFNDFVYFITGIDCQGAGKVCDTGLKGVCKDGLTDCGAGAEIECRPQVKPSEEKCDATDNNCDGVVDEGDLCPTGQVCDKGTCVGNCSKAEFACPPNLACNTEGHCVDPACQTVSCAEGSVCQAGKCVAPCDGVVCPKTQVCRVGKCLDPCDGVTCDNGRVCEQGVCVTACGCKACDGAAVCDVGGGHCVDAGCAGKSCGTGTVCVAGSCVDTCSGAVCPGGAMCANGQCGEPSSTPSTAAATTGSSGPIIGDDSSSSSSGPTSGGGMGGATSSGDAGGAGGSGSSGSGCGCIVGGSGDARAPVTALAGVLLLLLGLRRRR